MRHGFSALTAPTPFGKTVYHAMRCVGVVDTRQNGGRFRATTMCEDSRRDQKGLIRRRKWRWVLKISRYREEKKGNRESVWRKRRRRRRRRTTTEAASKWRFCREIIRTCLDDGASCFIYLIELTFWKCWKPNKTQSEFLQNQTFLNL